MAKTFASQGDLAAKKETFTELAPGVYCLTAEGDPNSGVIVGEDGVMVIDARATPAMAQGLIARIREVTDKPIRHVVLTHYHAVRVLGASAYGASEIIASETTRDLIVERGAQDMASEIQRFPRLFQAAETIPGLTWPTLTFSDRVVVWMGGREVHIVHAGRGHTAGDTVVWLPREKVMFAGDLVEYGATPYCGDAYFTDWPATLDRIRAFGATAMVPGRGEALTTAEAVERAIAETREFLEALTAVVRDCVGRGLTLDRVFAEAMERLSPRFGHWVIFQHCMPFDVSRCFDEMSGIVHPRIWTAERDLEMWRALEG
ncbi:MBL fold metallo-hydrolase [Arenibaculum pallidiluteum]|uniref:MBL fold metallo-hydrolase n=1 Tax=Arenibaculum pallidiluteum TaxID=2812559 RepID=UPI001A95D812|nr:MBL fold metallo-hydrolase [Arenibaculum pallidiluteum]